MSKAQVIPLKQATDLALVGGKALSLNTLLRNGFKTVNGFVITTTSNYHMNHELKEQILKAYDELGAEHVAVRSSAVAEDSKEATWAGQLDTFLNTTRDDLIESVIKCWSSAGSARALAYAEQKGLKAGKVAVIVQPMLQSEVAGVAFSVHPVTNNVDQIIIEAALGLGEAVVSGEITPDTYIVEKSSNKILEKYISNQHKQFVLGKNGKNEWRQLQKAHKQKLSDAKIKELTQIIKNLEIFYGFAIDTEWLIKDGELFIMQSRPITNLG